MPAPTEQATKAARAAAAAAPFPRSAADFAPALTEPGLHWAAK